MANKAKMFLNKMVELLDDINTTLLSDNDLFYLVNDQLPREHRISMSYFEFLKSPNQSNPKSISQLTTLSDEEKEEFISKLRVGRIKQKINLTKSALDDVTKNAYPNLWMLERKNTELQLRKSDDNIVSQPLIQITASNDEHKKLIDNILKGEPIHLQPKKEIEFEELNFDEVENIEIIAREVEPLNKDE